ncbi:MAG: phage tail protein [Pseudonocardiaceae bacterium]
MAEPEPFEKLVLQTFRFRISLTLSPSAPPAAVTAGSNPVADLLGDGGFQECTGLELEADIKDHLEGGSNDRIVRRVGRVKLQPIVLKRGMFAPALTNQGNTTIGPLTVRPDLWLWLQSMVSGKLPIPRYDGLVEVMDSTNTTPMATWKFIRALPSKVTGPTLNAKTGEIAVEELHIVHEGLGLV